ncbi:MAG: preprotein translocase subunit SecE [Acidobacteriota bacterium]
MSNVATTNQDQRGGGIATWPARVTEYFDGLRDEMRLVTWPAWKQVRATTIVVIAAVFLFAAYFAVVDELVGLGIEKLFKTFSA